MIYRTSICSRQVFFQRRKNGIDITHELDLSDFKDLSRFPKKAPKPESYVTILVLFYMFSEWTNTFATAAFFIMSYPYFIVNSKASITKRPISSCFPKKTTQFYMVRTIPGQPADHLIQKYNANFVSAAGFSTSAICNIDPKSRFLTVRNNETSYWMLKKNIRLLIDLVDLFTSQLGIVIDSFAGDYHCYIGYDRPISENCSSMKRSRMLWRGNETDVFVYESEVPFSRKLNECTNAVADRVSFHLSEIQICFTKHCK